MLLEIVTPPGPRAADVSAAYPIVHPGLIEREVEEKPADQQRDKDRDDELALSCNHRRDCDFADALSPSLLMHLLKVEGGEAEW